MLKADPNLEWRMTLDGWMYWMDAQALALVTTYLVNSSLTISIFHSEVSDKIFFSDVNT